MKKFIRFILLFLLVAIGISASVSAQPSLNGAWQMQYEGKESVLLFQDGYMSYAEYDLGGKQFGWTMGGPYTFTGDSILIKVEFNSKDSTQVGNTWRYAATASGNTLSAMVDGQNAVWTKTSASKNDLTGTWRITGRMDGGAMNAMQPGPRKTLKMLTGGRFQWFAINTETGQFFGTGGGTYTFENGKYVETIEFFSRDNARVGMQLSFDGKVEKGAWHHSGKSSKGDPIHEIWSRIQP